MNSLKLLLAALVICAPLAPLARAQYHSFNVPTNSDCILQEYRSPSLTDGIYDAIHENYLSSSDGGSAYFYGGMIHYPSDGETAVFYSFWPPTAATYPVGNVQKFIYAGKNMSWHVSIGEGTIGGITGRW